MNKSLFLYFFLLVSLNCLGQADSVERVASNIKISYNSSIIYPGFRAGIELPFQSIEKRKIEKSGKEKIIYKNRYISGNLSWYHHPTYHDNLYLTAEWIMRRTNSRGLFFEFSPGLGYSRTFSGGTTYKVDNKGKVSIKKLAGYNYALLTSGGGIGYDLSNKIKQPVSIFYKMNILFMFPYNSTIYLRPAMELGVIYKMSDFIMVNTKRKFVSKTLSK
jgi:hypothetical protein